MIDRLCTYALVVLVIACCSIVVFAPNAFGGDAGPEDAVGAPVLDAGLMPATAAADPSQPASGAEDAKSALPLDAGIPPSDEVIWRAAERFVGAVRDGDWREAVALALLILSWMVIRGGRKVPLLKRAWSNVGTKEVPIWKLNDEGGLAIVFGLATVGLLVPSLLGDQPVDFSMFRAAFMGGLGAIGIHQVWKKALKPGAKWIWGLFGG